MNSTNKLIQKLTESETTLDWRDWPEFKDLSEADIEDMLLDFPEMYVREYGGWYAADADRNFLLSLEPENHSYRLDAAKMYALLVAYGMDYTESTGYEPMDYHSHGSPYNQWLHRAAGADCAPWPKWQPEPEPPEYSLEQ